MSRFGDKLTVAALPGKNGLVITQLPEQAGPPQQQSAVKTGDNKVIKTSDGKILIIGI